MFLIVIVSLTIRFTQVGGKVVCLAHVMHGSQLVKFTFTFTYARRRWGMCRLATLNIGGRDQRTCEKAIFMHVRKNKQCGKCKVEAAKTNHVFNYDQSTNTMTGGIEAAARITHKNQRTFCIHLSSVHCYHLEKHRSHRAHHARVSARILHHIETPTTTNLHRPPSSAHDTAWAAHRDHQADGPLAWWSARDAVTTEDVLVADQGSVLV